MKMQKSAHCTPQIIVSDAFVVNALKLILIASIYCCRQMPFKILIETHELSTKEQRYRSQLKYVIETSTNSNSKTELIKINVRSHVSVVCVCARLHLYNMFIECDACRREKITFHYTVRQIGCVFFFGWSL